MSAAPQAEAEATQAREQLGATLSEIQRRLSPRNLVGDVTESVREHAVDLTGRSVAAVKARPIATAAIALPLIGFFFRHALARGVNSIIGQDADTK